MDAAARSCSNKRQKSYFPEKVCYVFRAIISSFDYYFFVRDFSRVTGNDVESVRPLVQLESKKNLSICGIDSTAFIVENARRNYLCRKLRPVYCLDLDPNRQPQSLNLTTSGDLRKLPPMSYDKYYAVITRVPNSKRLLVFSTLITFTPVSYDDDPSALDQDDFEMYDLDTESWVTLPTFCLRITGRRCRPVLQLYDPVARSWNRVRGASSVDARPKFCHITRFTFIDDTTLVVNIDLGFMLKLDLASLGQGWKVYKEGCDAALDEKVFAISESWTNTTTWCASNVMDMDSEEGIKLPLSSFDVSLEMIGGLTVTRLERKDYVCAMQAALRKKNGYPQVVIDVVDMGGDEVKRVATFRSEFRQLCSSVYPTYIFQYWTSPSRLSFIDLKNNSSSLA